MALWSDIITPVEATGIARMEIEERERQKGSLAQFLPNVYVASNHVKFFIGESGLVDEAFYRAFNAAPEIIGEGPLESRLVELPAVSTNQPIDERTQLDLARMSDDQARKSVEAAIRRAAWSIADRNEKTRGTVIHEGVARANQHNYLLNDNFGRNAALSITAPTLWSDASTDALAQIQSFIDVYAQHTAGEEPGAMVMSRKAFTAFSRLGQFRTVLAGGDSRPPMAGEVNGIVEAAGLPRLIQYNRSTKAGPVLDPNYIYLLPAPTDPSNPDGSELGATFWGQTVTSQSPEFGILPGEQPGAVVGVYREDRIPYTIEVMADAITLPVARNANRAMAIKVL